MTGPQLDVSRLAREWTPSKATLDSNRRRTNLISVHLMSVLDSWLLKFPRQIHELRLISVFNLGLSLSLMFF